MQLFTKNTEKIYLGHDLVFIGLIVWYVEQLFRFGNAGVYERFIPDLWVGSDLKDPA